MRVDSGAQRKAVVFAAFVLAAVAAISAVGWRNIIDWTDSHFSEWPMAARLLGEFGGGIAFGVAGLIVWYRRPGNVVGPLMALVGATLLMTSYWFVPVPALVTVGQWLSGAPAYLFGIVLLAYPSGRVASRLSRAWIVAALAFVLIFNLWQTLITPAGVWECPECRSLLLLSYSDELMTTAHTISMFGSGLLTLTLLALVVRRWLVASPPARRAMAPLWFSGLVYAAITLTLLAFDFAWFATQTLMLWDAGLFVRLEMAPVVDSVAPLLFTFALLLVPVSLVWGVLRSRLRQAAVSTLAIELKRGQGGVPLVETLRRALGDRSLEIGLWSRPGGQYVTPDGLPLSLPATGHDRAVTRLEAEDGPLAVMIHDPALVEQRALIDGVSAVAQLALENERLHAEVKAQLEEVRASRERIVSAADEERRRVERNLHDGAQQRLVSLSLALAMAQAKAADVSVEVAGTLAQAEGELKQAISELRELARGIHPAILTEAGLGAALESLADHSPVPVVVETDLDGRRLPPPVEGTAYFVAAEALTNVAKHAAASRVALSATVADGCLRLSVTDDGTGGADLDGGSGLRGLRDRVAALGGTLRVGDPPGGGTRLEAEIPCA